VSPDEATWAITSYAVAEAIVVPLTGWLTTVWHSARLSHRRAGLRIGLILCGVATTFPMLLFFRVVAGHDGGTVDSSVPKPWCCASPQPEKQNIDDGVLVYVQPSPVRWLAHFWAEFSVTRWAGDGCSTSTFPWS